MKRFLFYLILILSIGVFGQNENRIIDSILAIIDTTNNNENIILEYLNIGMNTRNMNIDTAFYYDSIGLEMAKKTSNNKLQVNGYNNVGLDKKQYGKLTQAENFFNRALALATKANDSLDMSMIYNNLGVLLADVGKYDEALEYYIKSLKIDEKYQNLTSLATTYNNIGIVHYTLSDYDHAMNYYAKAMHLNKKLGNTDSEALQLMNIGIIHYFKNNYDSVFIYFNRAKSLWQKTHNLRRLAMIQSNLAEMYMEIEAYDEAIKNLTQAKTLYDQLKEVFDVIHTELLLGDLHVKNNNFDMAKTLYADALHKAKNSKSIAEERLVYDSYQNMYLKQKNYKKAYQYQKMFMTLKDSLFNREKASIVHEMEAKYQNEKIQQQLVLAEKENKLIALEKKRLRTTLYFIILLALMLIVFVIFIIRAYQHKKQAYNLIREQKEEITTQRDLANEQNEIITKQKQAITDSIAYAQRIQDAIIPGKNEIANTLPNHFTFYLPKDVVSGDFYWVHGYDKKTLITLADCTGHGVPGAFMSMLGISFLNEIAKTSTITDAATVLEELRQNIIDALRQKDTHFEQIDGMDMALVILHNKTHQIEYAGARNPLYILSDKNLAADNPQINFKISSHPGTPKKLYVVAADKMPVAKYIKMVKFKNNTINLHPDDQVVLFTDGITDQFGGSENLKYQSGNFKNLLLQIAHKPLDEQQKIINQEYFKWKGSTEQIDDVSIFSFKI